MKIGWAIIYIMGSAWIVGVIMSITGLPFGKDGLTGPIAPRAGLAAPAVAAPRAVVQAPALATVKTTAPAPIPAAVTAPAAAASQHISHDSVAATETKGGQLMQPRLEGGVKGFDLEVKVIKWEVLPGTFVEAWAYNGQVPGR